MFIGDEFAARSLDFLEDNNITHIVNAKGPGGQNYHEKDDNFTYFYFGVCKLSSDHAKLTSHKAVLNAFEPVHSFIDAALAAGKSVLVHCAAGAHRAGTTGVSYMMRAAQLTFKDAYMMAKKVRPVVDPFGSLKQLLLKLEKA